MAAPTTLEIDQHVGMVEIIIKSKSPMPSLMLLKFLMAFTNIIGSDCFFGKESDIELIEITQGSVRAKVKITYKGIISSVPLASLIISIPLIFSQTFTELSKSSRNVMKNSDADSITISTNNNQIELKSPYHHTIKVLIDGIYTRVLTIEDAHTISSKKWDNKFPRFIVGKIFLSRNEWVSIYSVDGKLVTAKFFGKINSSSGDDSLWRITLEADENHLPVIVELEKLVEFGRDEKPQSKLR